MIQAGKLRDARAYRRLQMSMFFENVREWLWIAVRFVFGVIVSIVALFVVVRLVHAFWYM